MREKETKRENERKRENHCVKKGKKYYDRRDNPGGTSIFRPCGLF